MIPIRDDNPTRHFPIVTILLIAANVIVYLFFELPLTQKAMIAFINQYGFVPSRLFLSEGPMTPIPPLLTVFTSMFLHGGIFHLGGNMLYLWIFGNNIEDITGRVRFIIFYLLCGTAGALLQGIMSPSSTVPMVGASGAVSGVLGAYFIRYPFAKVTVLIPFFFFIHIMKIPALMVLGLWILFQVFNGFSTLQAKAGVAFFAHIGGFVSGIILLKVFEQRKGKR